jgi:hypothetical protein
MKIGTQDVTSIENPKTVTESRLSFLYDKTKRSVIRAAVWNFAQEIATIPSISETVPEGFSKVYAFPNDFIRFIGIMVNGMWSVLRTEDYMIAGGKIYVKNYSSDSLTIKYIREVNDVRKFDDLFIETLVLKLAYELCFIETQKSALTNRLLQEYDMKIAEAKAISGQEQRPRKISVSRWGRIRNSVANSGTAMPWRE